MINASVHQNWCQRFGRLLRRNRARLGKTQSQLGDACGLPQGHLSRYEAGAHMPSGLHLLLLVRAYGISQEDLATLSRR